MNISAVERQEKIVRLLEQNERITINEVTQVFSISVATARRDLETLADQGKLRRVHGGAIPVQEAPPEMPLFQRQHEQFEEKARIGRRAAQLVRDGETIILSGGTTTLEVARHLRDRLNLTVITNSLLVAMILSDVPAITLIGLGGLFRHSEKSFIGHLTEQSMTDLRADKVIMGIRALDIDEGLTNAYLQEAVIDRAMMRIGREIIVVADHTKLGRVTTAYVAPVTAITTLVTDNKAPSAFVEGLNDAGIQVLLA